jgi:hypothetical protein
VPELRPVTEAEAANLGAYARQLHTVANVSGPTPVGWSMVNQACQDRAIALEYALAAAGDPLEAEPPPMVDTELTIDRIADLAAAPRYDVASINATGPLVTFQSFRMPDSTPMPGDPDMWYWAYHHGVVLNVEGELRVMDLSVGDAPLPIATWLQGFVAPGIECELLPEAEYQAVWIYWNAAFGNFDPGARPVPLCAYTVTPMFTFRSDQTSTTLADFIASVPSTMQVQLGALATWIGSEHQTTLLEAELPAVTSLYQAGTEQDVCDLVAPIYCQTL